MTTETALITDVGEAAAIAADGSGLDLKITHVAIGAAAYTPATNMTALVDLREVAPVLVGAKQGAQVTLTATFRASLYAGAAYGVGEIGFYAGNPTSGGILVAVISAPGRSAPARGGANITNYSPTFVLALSGVPTGSIGVTFDPTAGAGLVALSAHVAAPDPHPQYNLGGAPLGMVAPFYATAAPSGWLALSGQTVARDLYPALWTHAQAQSLVVTDAAWAASSGMFSSGDGSTTFRLPDLRSEFIRAWDNARGVDSGRELASLQGSANLSHTHGVRADNGGFNTNASNVVSGTDRPLVYTAQTDPSGGSESRPRNVSLLMCIKAT